MNQRGVFSLLIWAALVASALVIVAIFPRFLAVYYSYYGQASIEKIFYEVIGLDAPLSRVLAVPFAVLYGLAWVVVVGWAGAVVSWKLDAKKLLITLPCFVLFYALAPAAQLVIGTPCFNQRDGTPQKWYVIRSDGKVVLYDSPGFDPETGVQKVPVTQEICRISSDQKRGQLPQKISDQAATELDPNVWYAVYKDQTEFFDKEGIHPRTLQPLQPVTADVLAPVKARLARTRAQAEKDRLLAQKQQEAKDRADQLERDRLDKIAREQQAAQDRKDQKEIQAKRRVLVQSLAEIRQTSNPSEYDCLIDEDGVYLGSKLNSRQATPFTSVRVAAGRKNVRTNILFLAVQTSVVVVQVMGPTFENDSNQACFIYSINPAPADISQGQIDTINNVISALSELGAQVTQQYIPDTPPPVPLQPDSPVSSGEVVVPGGGGAIGGSYYTGPSYYTGSGGYIGTGNSSRGGGRR
jgi:hypothetical protein